MAELVTYDRTDLVSTLTMDDGKVNVFSIPMLPIAPRGLRPGRA